MPAQFALLALALTAVTADYATGGIVPTLQWTPRRGVLFARPHARGGRRRHDASACCWRWAPPSRPSPAARRRCTCPGTTASTCSAPSRCVVAAGTALAVGLGFLLRNTAGALVAVVPADAACSRSCCPQFGYAWMSAIAAVLPGSGAAFLLLGEVPRMTEASSVTVLLGLGRRRAAARLAAAASGTTRTGDRARHGVVDVLVVGAGLAGLHTATLLAERGHDVLLVERRPTLTGAIRTTGIFVRKTLDDFPLPPECLGPPIRRVVLYPPGLRRPVTLVSDRDEYRVGDMAPLYVAAARAAADAGVRIALGTRYAGRRTATSTRLAGPDGPIRVRARFVVGADGARSRVARDLGLDRNHHLLVGAEEVFDGPARRRSRPTFHCVLDPSLAPGYLAWVVNDGRHAHVGVAGYAAPLPPRAAPGPGAVRRLGARAAGVDRPGRGRAARRPHPGRWPAAPDRLRRRAARGRRGGRGLAAHRRRPRSVPAAVGARRRRPRRRPARRAADALAHYDGAALRAPFRGRLLLRRGLAQVRTPAVAAAAFALLRTPLGRAAARRILFGDRSFPASAAGPPQAGGARHSRRDGVGHVALGRSHEPCRRGRRTPRGRRKSGTSAVPVAARSATSRKNSSNPAGLMISIIRAGAGPALLVVAGVQVAARPSNRRGPRPARRSRSPRGSRPELTPPRRRRRGPSIRPLARSHDGRGGGGSCRPCRTSPSERDCGLPAPRPCVEGSGALRRSPRRAAGRAGPAGSAGGRAAAVRRRTS